MEIISWIVMGLVTGSMARVAMPGPAAGGMSIAILIGLVGVCLAAHWGRPLRRIHWLRSIFTRCFVAAIGAMMTAALLFVVSPSDSRNE